MAIVFRAGSVIRDYARLNGENEMYESILLCAFTSKTSESPPNIYVSLGTIYIDAFRWGEPFETRLSRVIDHELFHLFSPTVSPPWDRDETGAMAFEEAGGWAHEAD